LPKGTLHELTGVLLDNGLYPILRVRDGGEWRLDITGRYLQLLGQHVKVIGRRSGFDLLDVDRIEAA